ncbi:type II secretion system protein [Microaceticoccus formicicus]|uniref:type II secretion system protein n=1 Tax=Microaceticoccus formicicus TaxID=3118105 RepID=UPI003CD01710|nr:prepilin-type N-terminal cleavage/methylation domain-containing protein [Peptoniphilaceae bacterium AMB_02]
MLIRKGKKRGFTLVELVIVIAILALLAAIALPKFVNSRQKARETAHIANVRVLKSAATTYLADEGNPKDGVVWDVESKNWEKYIDKWPKNPLKSGDYKVTISDKGEITVTPGEDESSEGNTNPGTDG